MADNGLLELAACPFCGGTDVSTRYVRDGRQMACNGCGASVAPTYHGPAGDTLERAKRAWNTRDLSAECGVKALEWSETWEAPDGQKVWCADPASGALEFTYSIWLSVDGRYHAPKLLEGYFGTLDAAKAAAQADFDQRIRSAIVPGVESVEREPLAHRKMTREEYNALNLKGWHSVRHDEECDGVTEVSYTAMPATPSAAVREALDKLRDMNAAEYLRVVARDTRHVFDKNELPKIAVLIEEALSGQIAGQREMQEALEPVVFRVQKANEDGLTLSKTEWIYFSDEDAAKREADALMAEYQALYVHRQNTPKFKRDGEDYLICEGHHHVDEPCEFVRYAILSTGAGR